MPCLPVRLLPSKSSCCCTRPARPGRGGIFCSPFLLCAICAVLFATLSAPCHPLCSQSSLSFFHALNCRSLPSSSKRPGLALQLPASHFPRCFAIAVVLFPSLAFLVRALAAHAHTLTTQYPLFLHLTGSRNPSAYLDSAPNSHSTSLRV